MKILLVEPPHYYGVNSRPPSSFPLGLAYVAGVLNSAGHELELMDIYAHQLKDIEVTRKIAELPSDIDVICISALSTQYKYVKWLVRELKARFDKPVILGNALATFNVDAVFTNTGVDICVISEGEETVVDLLNNLSSLHLVKGIAYKNHGKVHITPKRPYIKNIDSIGFPARSMFNMDIYLDNTCLWSDPDIRTMDIVSARGCPYSCNFCSRTFDGVRLRSVANIIEEIESLRSKYDFKGIKFNDELTLVNKERTYELCVYMKKARLFWVCQGRVNLVDRDLLKAMKDSGCRALGFGVESGSNKILANMNKCVSIERAVEAIKITKQCGIEPIIQMMFGYPGENEQTLKDTIEFFKAVNSPTMQFSVTTALPGTKLYADACKNGLIVNEDAYLEKLDWGYYAGRDVLINFTDFKTEDLDRKRRETEEAINRNYKRYIMMRPWVACGIILRKLRSYYLRYGIVKTVLKSLNFTAYFKKDSWVLG